MDIANIRPNDRTIEIRDPGTAEPIGVRVTIMSRDDERMKKTKRLMADRNIQAERRGKTLKADERERNGVEFLFAAMIGWEWYGEDVTFNGEKPEFNLKNVAEVFEKLPWFKTQVDEEIADDQRFFAN